MRKLNRKLCRGGKTKRKMKSGGKVATNKMTTYNIDKYQLGGNLTNLSNKIDESGVDMGGVMGGLGASVAGFMNAESPAQKASAIGQGISSTVGAIPGPVGLIGQIAGKGIEIGSEIVNAKQMKEQAEREQLAATKDAQQKESMKILANYDSKGTGMSIAVKKGGRIPKNGVYPYQEQKFGSNLVDLTISPNIHPPTRMFADGGSLRPISNTSSQVVGDNPNATDDVNMGDYYLDHDETTVETPTGMDIYSAELTIPGTKTTFADANKKLQSQKKMLPKTQARTLGHIVPKGRNAMSDLPDPKFAAYNDKIDEDAKRLFIMQELQKATPQQLAMAEQNIATAGEDMSGDIQRPQTQFALGGNSLDDQGVAAKYIPGDYDYLSGTDAAESLGSMTRPEYEQFMQNTTQVPALRENVNDAGWANALNRFKNDPDLFRVNMANIRSPFGSGDRITGEYRTTPESMNPIAPEFSGSGSLQNTNVSPIPVGIPQGSNKVNAYNYKKGRPYNALERFGRKLQTGGRKGYQLGGQRNYDVDSLSEAYAVQGQDIGLDPLLGNAYQGQGLRYPIHGATPFKLNKVPVPPSHPMTVNPMDRVAGRNVGSGYTPRMKGTAISNFPTEGAFDDVTNNAFPNANLVIPDWRSLQRTKKEGAGTTGGGGQGSTPAYPDYTPPEDMAYPAIEGPSFDGSYDRAGNSVDADGNIIAQGLQADDVMPDEVADVYEPGTPAPQFRDPNVIENYGASLLRMFQNPAAVPRPAMQGMVNLREVRPDAELANLASQRATMMKHAQRASANPNVAFGQQNRIFGMSTDAQNKIMGNIQRTNAAIQSREAMINSQIGARNLANLNRMRQQEAERKMAKQRNIVDSASEMRAINLSGKRQKNQRELDMWRWNIAKDRFGDSGVPKRTESLLGLTDYTTGNRKKRYD